MKVNIRKAEFEDYPIFCELIGEVDAYHANHLPHTFQKTSDPIRERGYYQELLENENIGIFIAEVNGVPAGFIHAAITNTPKYPLFVPRRYAVIDAIGVTPTFQNQGIGQDLMNTAEDWAAAHGASAIELHVYEFNQAALGFYQKLGYETLSRRMSKSLTGTAE